MTEQLLSLVYASVALFFGIFLTSAFAGIPFARKTVLANLSFGILNVALQGFLYLTYGESLVWKLYPLITHLPLLLFLVIVFRKPFFTVLVSIFTVYLCCQPSKWLGLLAFGLSNNSIVGNGVRIGVLILLFALMVPLVSPTLSKLFGTGRNISIVLAVVPAVYYIFDYATTVYSNIWETSNQLVMEFLPFFISIMFIVFCVVYYREYEDKFYARRTEEIVRLTVEQQRKEIESIKRSEHELRILRHDLRLFLSTLAVCIETDEKSVVRDMIESYSEHVAGTEVQRYCADDTINYVLSDFDGKCQASHTRFVYEVEIGKLTTNEILFSSILSNALDNALHAVKDLPEENRTVILMLKETSGKLLLSVKNPMRKEPIVLNGLLISRDEGHGYGTQSIRYMTEKLGGSCQFSIKDSLFVVRVIV